MRVSDCCGVGPENEHGLCPRCKENCEFVSEEKWEEIAKAALHALRLLSAHYEDIAKSNPGFLGKLFLQNYALMNEALIAEARVLREYRDIEA